VDHGRSPSLGVIAVAQLQKPIDEQDAIRQTTKFLPLRPPVWSSNRPARSSSGLQPTCRGRSKTASIFTVVTKPTTRLEIVLGKILGFARVSAAILFIMGLFTWGYLHVRALSLQQTHPGPA